MMMLYHEHDAGPEMRPDPIEPERREEIIAHIEAGLLPIYRYYLSQRGSPTPHRTSKPIRREAAKVGRNDP